jgi:hypothetical protein
LCVIGAVCFAQGPEFIQQYFQRLGGHLQESQRQLASFHDAAAHAGLPFEQFITRTGANTDAGLSHLGTVMSETASRTASLQAAHDALLTATPWTRPFVFIKQVDWDIAHATAANYLPAVPTTLEGLAYAAVGMLILLASYRLGIAGAGALLRRRIPIRSATPS